MRKIITVGLLVLMSFLAQAAAFPVPKVQKINDRVYALLGPIELPNKSNQGYMVNTTVIIGEKGVILVDTGFTDEIALSANNKPILRCIIRAGLCPSRLTAIQPSFATCWRRKTALRASSRAVLG